jgi:hypothetical protein
LCPALAATLLALWPVTARAQVPASVQSAASQQIGLTGGRFIKLENVPTSPRKAFTVRLPIGDDLFTLTLEPHALRGPHFQLIEEYEPGRTRVIAAPPPRTLRGELVELAGSSSAGSLRDDGLYASILLENGTLHVLEPLSRFGGAANDYVLYQRGDVQGLPAGCIVKVAGKEAVRERRQAFGSGDPCPGAGLYIAELATDADYEYFLAYGSVAAVNTQIESIINTMNLEYERDVSITHQLSAMVVRSTVSDPYSSSDPETLLDQLTSHWNFTQQGVERDVVQLFTGRDLTGSTIGIAWLGATSICGNLAYGLVQSNWNGLNGSFACKTDLSAHELGHNWNAPHCSCPQWTMNTTISSCNNQFHPTFSIPPIVAYRDSRTCLEFVEEDPQLLRLTITPAAPTVPEGGLLEFEVTVDLPEPPCTQDYQASGEVAWLVDPPQAGYFDELDRFVASGVSQDTPVTVTAFYDGIYGSDDATAMFTILDDDSPGPHVHIELLPSVPADRLLPGQSFTIDVLLSAPDGAVPDVRLLQFDTSLTTGSTVDGINWTFDTLLSGGHYLLFDTDSVHTAVYLPPNALAGFIVELTGTPQRVAQLEMTFHEDGSANVLGDPSPPSQDFGVLFLSGFAEQIPFSQAEGNVNGGAIELSQIDDLEPSIMSSVPPMHAIDARQPTDLNGSNVAGWSSFEIQFSGDVAGITTQDFEVSQNGGTGSPPEVIEVSPLGADSAAIVLSGAIEPGAWTELHHLPSGSSARWGFLPADVNGDGTSSPLDILDLIDSLNGLTDPPLPEWATDIDRSGAANPADVLRLIDLLNGAGSFEVWNGAQLPE